MITRTSLLFLQYGCVSFFAAFGLISPAGASTTVSAKVSTSAPSLQAFRLGSGERIEIDGRLDEKAWQSAEQIGGFVERNPTPGAQPPVKNRLMALYDEDAIYIGLAMGLLPGETPVGRTMSRDTSRIWRDDAITIKFDVLRDFRTTLGFAINLATAQIDFIALENGRTFRTEYDAVWEASASNNDEFWYAEFRIPLAELGLPYSDVPRAIGFNASRDHAIRNAVYDWSQMPPGYGPASALHYGKIEGFEKVGGGTPFTIIPYVLAQYPADAKAGLDVRMRVATDSWLEITTLTDFAQIDLDDPVVNLSRFPLRLAEKRPFFLSGLEIFNFNSPMLFFSRRIGLDEDAEQIPIYSGLKFRSRIGPWGVGLLDVVTEQAHSAVGRVRYNFGNVAYLGLMSTMQHELNDLSRVRHASGVDVGLRLFDYRLSINTDWTVAHNEPRSLRPKDMAGAFDIQWLEEPFKPRLTFRFVGTEFDPVLGFVRRDGFFSAKPTLLWVERPEYFGLQTLQFRLAGTTLRTDDFEEDLGQNASFTVKANFRNGWSSKAQVKYQRDIVEEDFDLLGNVSISADTYEGALGLFEIGSNNRNDLSGTVSYSFGNHYFDGQLQQVKLASTWNANRLVRVSADAVLSFVNIPVADRFTTATLKATAEVTPTPDVVSNVTLLLVDNDLSASVDRGVAQVRVRWRYRPGSDVFFVYREDLDFVGTENAARSLSFKLNYRFDTVF